MLEIVFSLDYEKGCLSTSPMNGSPSLLSVHTKPE